MAIPVLDREGEGQPLVTYPSITDSSSSDNLTACPNRGAGPLSRHLRPCHFTPDFRDDRTRLRPTNSWSISRPKGTAVSAVSRARNPEGNDSSGCIPKPGQRKS
jgi:hypothetical protein